MADLVDICELKEGASKTFIEARTSIVTHFDPSKFLLSLIELFYLPTSCQIPENEDCTTSSKANKDSFLAVLRTSNLKRAGLTNA